MLRRTLLALALSCLSEAQGLEWSRKDTVMEGAFLALLAVDYFQTRDLVANPKHRIPGRELYEHNPLLGPSPTMGEVNSHFAISALGHVAISALLPAGAWRTTWQGIGIAVEGAVVANNYKLGLRVKW